MSLHVMSCDVPAVVGWSRSRAAMSSSTRSKTAPKLRLLPIRAVKELGISTLSSVRRRGAGNGAGRGRRAGPPELVTPCSLCVLNVPTQILASAVQLVAIALSVKQDSRLRLGLAVRPLLAQVDWAPAAHLAPPDRAQRLSALLPCVEQVTYTPGPQLSRRAAGTARSRTARPLGGQQAPRG